VAEVVAACGAAEPRIVGVVSRQDIDDYVNIAVRLGTDDVWRKQVIAKVRERVHLLYHRTESIDAWATLLSFLAEEGPPKSTPGEEEDEAGAVVAMDGTRVVFGLA
jgi:hypothetical protein